MNYRIVLRKKRYKQSNTIFRVELLCYFALSLCRVISLLHRTVFKTSRHPTKATGNFKHIRRFLGGKQLRVLQIHHTSPQDPQIFNFFRASYLYPMLGIVTHFDTLPQMSNSTAIHLHGIVLRLLYEPETFPAATLFQFETPENSLL